MKNVANRILIWHIRRMTTDEAIKAVQREARLSMLSKAEMARRAGIHFRTLTDMYKEDWSPTTTVLRKLEAVIEEHKAS